MKTKDIWVWPEIKCEESEAGKLSLGLLTDARTIAEKASGRVTAILFGEQYRDYSGILGQYGVNRLYFFQDPLLEYFSAEAYTGAMLDRVRRENPWLLLFADTGAARELAPRLAVSLNSGLVTNCTKIDLGNPLEPKFYRPVYGGQLYQEIVFQTGRPMLVTRPADVLDLKPSANATAIETLVIKPELNPETLKARHISYLPADFQNMDISQAKTIVGAGMGAATDELMPLVEELADLIQGAIGATRPVVDEGKVPRERLIGQTGKIVSPDFYLALGISGATHHIAGVQGSGQIVVINRDRYAAFFQNADAGISADLKDVLPILIARIKSAKKNGEII